MRALRVTIDRRRQAVSFEGPGTFEAKEAIRGLGPARWYGDRKVWEVTPFSGDQNQLKAVFSAFQLDILELDASAAVDSPFKLDTDTSALLPGFDMPSVSAGEISRPSVSGSIGSAVVSVSGPEAALTSPVPLGIGVSQLLGQARAVLRGAFPKPVIVQGIVAQIKRAAGRVYLDLADGEKPDERINGVIWQGEQQILEPLRRRGFELEKDLPVMFEAAVELSRRDGRLTLSIRAVVAEFTVAKLQAQRDETNRRLKEEGLFDRNRKQSLPLLPRRLGIITSAAGTVINDFRSSLDLASFGFELFWCHSAMQGQEAKPQVLSALRRLEQLRDLDAILIFRGGGSAAELSVFNDYEIAKAVCLCRLPIISAIGHQEDQCSVQDVSFRGLGVPKDVGRFFADIVIELRRNLQGAVERISVSSGALADQTSSRLRLLAQALRASAQSAIDRPRQFIQSALQTLPSLISRNLLERMRRMNMICQAIGPLVGRSCDHGTVSLGAVAGRLSRNVHQLHDRAAYSARAAIDRLQAGSRGLDVAGESLSGYERLFEQISPERQLKRGFAMVRRGDGSFVHGGAGLEAGDEIEVQFFDLNRRAKISE